MPRRQARNLKLYILALENSFQAVKEEAACTCVQTLPSDASSFQQKANQK